MDERKGDRPGESRERGERGEREGRGERGERGGGPQGTEWLDLEISRVLSARADEMTRSVAEEILRDAIKVRLRERLGDRLEAIGRAAADKLADGVEASLDIEARIAAHAEALRPTKDRAQAAPPSGEGAPPSGRSGAV